MGGKFYILLYRCVCVSVRGKHNEENGEDRNQAIVDNLAENTRSEKRLIINIQ